MRRKEARAKLKEQKRSGVAATSLPELVEKARSKTAEYEDNEEFVSSKREKIGSGRAVEGSLKAYYKEFRKVRVFNVFLLCLPSL